ncbi:MAG: proton-conducting transporter membrane subunit [Desulfurococcaceae archaeon]
MNLYTIKVLYALTLYTPILSSSVIIDKYPRLSKLLRIVGYIGVPATFMVLGLFRLPDFQVLLVVTSSLVAIAISLHSEGYYKVVYGLSRYFQVVVDNLLALLILTFSSSYFVELLVYWFLLDLLVAFTAITLERGSENIPVAATYLAMCAAPSDVAILTMFSLLANKLGFYQALTTPLSEPPEVLGLDPIMSAIIAFGMATKLGQFPLHTWLPIVHGEAPTHISAILSGLVIKLGAFGLLVASKLFVLDPVAYYMLLAQGVISTIYGSFGAVLQSNLKRLLAYSSIGYGGLIVVLSSIRALWGLELAYAALLTLIAFHIVVKSLAFINTAFIYQAANTYDVYRLGYLYYVSRALSFCAFTTYMNLLGMPPSAGFFVKVLLVVLGIVLLGVSNIALAVLPAIAVSIVFSIAYSAKLISAYTSRIPRVAPKYVPIAMEVKLSELYLSILSVLMPLPALYYAIARNLVDYHVAASILTVYFATILLYAYAIWKEAIARGPPREDIKYWLSGVEA